MSGFKIAAVVLIVAGALGLFYGAFSYTKETHRAQLGSLELTTRSTETVNIPAWAGVAALVAGGLMLVVSTKKS